MFYRQELINYLIERNNYKRYLEIGVEDGHSLHSVKCQIKHGVDPNSKHATFHLTSDDFFYQLAPHIKYDLIFIDGLHLEDQVDRDIKNSLKHLSSNGIIVVHDCNPPTSWHQRSYQEAKKNGFRLWNGTVWRSIVKLRATRPDLLVQVVDTDWGCGLIKPINNIDDTLTTNSEIELPSIELFNYEYLEQNRELALNLISVELFKTLY